MNQPEPTADREAPQDSTQDQGRALLRVARDLRGFIEGEDVPTSLLTDLETVEQVGRWLAGTPSLSFGGMRTV